MAELIELPEDGNFLRDAPRHPTTGTPTSGYTPEQMYQLQLLQEEKEAAKAAEVPIVETTGAMPGMGVPPIPTGETRQGDKSRSEELKWRDRAIEHNLLTPGSDPTKAPPEGTPGFMGPPTPPELQAPTQLSQVTQDPIAERLAAQTHKPQGIADLDNAIKEKVAYQATLLSAQSGGVEAAQANIKNIAQAFKDVDGDMAKMRVDPRKWEKETPALTKALLLIGAGAFGWITKGRGPNPLIQLIDRAIERDVDSQMKNVDIGVKRGKQKILGAEMENSARSTLAAAYYQRAMLAYDAMSQNVRDEQARTGLQISMEELGLRRQVAQEKAYMDRVKLMGGGASGGAGEGLDKNTKERLDSYLPYMRDLYSVTNLKLKAGKGVLGAGPMEAGMSYVPNSKANQYSRLKNELALKEAFVYSGKQMTAKEAEVFTGTYSGSLDSNETTADLHLKKFDDNIFRFQQLVDQAGKGGDARTVERYKDDLSKAQKLRDATAKKLGRPLQYVRSR